MKKEDCFFLGYFSSKHGFKGGLNLKLDVTPNKEIKGLNHLFIDIDNDLVPFFVQSFKIKNKNIALLVLDEIDCEDKAQRLIGKQAYASKEFLSENDTNSIKKYISYRATDINKGDIGIIEEILFLKGQNLFRIIHNDNEILIPHVEAFIISACDDKKEIIFNTPEGLIEMYT